MELAPTLQFKHYTVSEAHLPGEALMRAPDLALGEAEICCDLEHNVFNAEHTEPAIGDALRESHWFELEEWARGPGAGSSAA